MTGDERGVFREVTVLPDVGRLLLENEAFGTLIGEGVTFV